MGIIIPAPIRYDGVNLFTDLVINAPEHSASTIEDMYLKFKII